MEKVIKQSVGIDCSKETLDVSFSIMNDLFESQFLSTTVFSNDKAGWAKLNKWADKLRDEGLPIQFVIEATGVYHESVCMYLFMLGKKISVLLPNKVKKFAGTLKTKTVNDRVSAQTIAQMGLEKKLDDWQPPHEVFNLLRQLTRERNQLVEEKTQILCEQHAEKSGAWPNKRSIQRMKQRIRLIEKQIDEIEKELVEVVDQSPWLKQKLNDLCSIPGIGFLTAVTVSSETNGFNLIRNKKQLVSYAGLDVIEKQSGSSVKRKTKISRKGNKHIRRAMYFPALSAKRKGKMNEFYSRIEARNGIKMQAAVAVQRKLLELMYILWKKNERFDPNYKVKKLEQLNRAALIEMA